jgi:hypothetical protein
MKHAQTTSEEYWTMQAKPTAYWKFVLGANLFKGYQLDFVERRGNTIRVRVQSGKEVEFTVGEFKGEYVRTKEGNRDFTIRSTSGPKRKITFRETLLQMPEKWWDELEQKLGASETGLSKVLHSLQDIFEGLGAMQV